MAISSKVKYLHIKSKKNNGYYYFLKSKLLPSEKSFNRSSQERKNKLIEYIEHSEESINKRKTTENEVEKRMLNNGLQELIIEVTTACNFNKDLALKLPRS